MRCFRCGYEWTPRTGAPKACPGCKSYKFTIATEKEGKEEAKKIFLKALDAFLKAIEEERPASVPKGVPYVKGATGPAEGEACQQIINGAWVDGTIKGGKFIPNAPIIEKGA